MNPPGRRFPVTSIGKPLQQQPEGPSKLVQQMLASVQPTAAGPMLNAEMIKGAPPWAVGLMNMFQNGLAEVSALKLALMRRGLITETEFAEAAIAISQEYDKQFNQMVQQIDRTVNQQPSQPVDPRRPPQS